MLIVDMELTAEFHSACVTRDEAALNVLLDKLGNARIGFMDGAGEDARLVDNTSFYNDRKGHHPTVFPDGIPWDGWRGDLVWKESTPKPHKCAVCREKNCPVRQMPVLNF